MRSPAKLVRVLALLLLAPAALNAQGLRDEITQLFIFGPGQDPLFLAGSANAPGGVSIHGNHFVPAANAANGSMIDFLTDAIGANVANVPLGATSSGATFRFEGGVPVKTSTSAGPIFGERAQTLGRGRVLAGLNYSSFHFKSLRGIPLSDIQLNFTHENVNFPSCDSLFHANCALMGVPSFENDVMAFRLALDVNVHVTSFYLTYGLFDRLDVGVAIPLVKTTLTGSSFAQVIPFGGDSAFHFFAGTPTNPVLTASREVQGSSFGLGDIAIRAKVNLRETPRASVAILGDARLATGSAEDLLGSGSFAARGLAVVSARFSNFSPHANLGYLYRRSAKQNDAVLGTLGFDQLLGEYVTLAVDLVSELQVGQSKLTLPPPVSYDAPFRRTVDPTTIPNMRDDIFNGSFGFKFSTGTGATVIANALFPLNSGGLRTNVAFTGGVEYSF
jgi:hypothetical protein